MLLRRRAQEPGAGRVLVVDGGGSLECALLGDNIASLALASGWAGIVLNGCVRDSVALDELGSGSRHSARIRGRAARTAPVRSTYPSASAACASSRAPSSTRTRTVSSSCRRRERARPVQIAAASAGAAFVLAGIAGFVPGLTTHVGEPRLRGHASEARLLGVFQVSVLHNLLHLGVRLRDPASRRHRRGRAPTSSAAASSTSRSGWSA